MRMQPDFEKANEIYFRLGIIYKQQQKFGQSLEVCIVALAFLPTGANHRSSVLRTSCRIPHGH